MPTGGYVETFAVMCAAIPGAATTSSAEVGRSPPERIVVEGGGSALIIVPAGKQAMLVAAVDEPKGLPALLESAASFAAVLAVGSDRAPTGPERRTGLAEAPPNRPGGRPQEGCPSGSKAPARVF
jgi:hypothetical protein